MEISLFFLGALGAIIVLYLAKQTVIPEFRPLFDTTGKEQEADIHKTHTKEIEKDINEIQEKLKQSKLEADEAERLKMVLETSLSELQIERTRLQKLESSIMCGQIITRSLGFIIYVILGGVFGALLTGYVSVEGLTGNLPKAFEAVVIGASWTTYLSVIGFSGLIKKNEEKYEADIQKIVEENKIFKDALPKLVADEVAKFKEVQGPQAKKSSEQSWEPLMSKVITAISMKSDDRTENTQNYLDKSKKMTRRTLSAF